MPAYSVCVCLLSHLWTATPSLSVAPRSRTAQSLKGQVYRPIVTKHTEGCGHQSSHTSFNSFVSFSPSIGEHHKEGVTLVLVFVPLSVMQGAWEDMTGSLSIQWMPKLICVWGTLTQQHHHLWMLAHIECIKKAARYLHGRSYGW